MYLCRVIHLLVSVLCVCLLRFAIVWPRYTVCVWIRPNACVCVCVCVCVSECVGVGACVCVNNTDINIQCNIAWLCSVCVKDSYLQGLSSVLRRQK